MIIRKKIVILNEINCIVKITRRNWDWLRLIAILKFKIYLDHGDLIKRANYIKYFETLLQSYSRIILEIFKRK